MFVRRSLLLVVLAPIACVDQARTGQCDALDVPDGFCATEFARSTGPVRHLAVTRDGILYAGLWREGQRSGGVLALQDTNGDGRADRRAKFGGEGGSGIALRDSVLYHATWSVAQAYTLTRGVLEPSGSPRPVVTGMPETEHGARSIAVDGAGNLYVNVGVPSNACERDYPARDFRGQEPCAELSLGGGIWRFRANGAEQPFAVSARYATGLRHTVAMTVDRVGALWGAPHAIDHLNSWWPDAGYSREDAASVPSETLHRIVAGADFGFPYCIYDGRSARLVRSPAYARSSFTYDCAALEQPTTALEPHSAPLALVFYEHSAFPERYRRGLFVALHGSLFRSPLSPTGYSVTFIPFVNGRATTAEMFASSRRRGPGLFARPIRPSGLAVDSSGSLFISDDTNERIWRITWIGT